MIGGQFKERRQMSSYVQMFSPLLTIALAAAICFGVASYIVGQAKLRP
jgi:hypothetical protein